MSHSGFWDTTEEIMSKAATYYNGTGSTHHFVPSALVAYELYEAGNYTLP